MGTTTRQAGIGIGAAADQFCNCRWYTAATWNTVLSDAECILLTTPGFIRVASLTKDNFGYVSSNSLQQWYRAGLAPLASVANSAYVANDAANINTQPSLVEGALNMTVADIFQDAPG